MNRDRAASVAAHPKNAPWQKTDLLFLGLFFVVALVLRLCLRTHESIWLDEANSVLMARRDLFGMVKALMVDGNPPGYYFLLHGWIKVFGEAESGLRVFSALLGALLPAVLYWAARPFLPRRAAAISAGLALLWPLHVYYSQQVRMYALLPALSAAFVRALLPALEPTETRKPWWRSWGPVVLLGVALCMTHNYGTFVVLAAPCIWLLHGPRTKGTFLRLAAALGLVVLLYLPWLRVALLQARTDVGSWIAYSFQADAPLRSLDIFGTCVQLLPSGDLPPSFPPLWVPSTLWLITVFAGALWFAWKCGERRGLVLALLALLLVPILVPYAVSLVAKPIYLVGRYEVVAYPGFALLIGVGADCFLGTLPVSRGRPRHTRILAAAFCCAAYLALSGFVLWNWMRLKPERTEDRIVTSLSRWLSPGDAVICTGLGRAPMEYYLDRQGWVGRIRLISFPQATEKHLGWYDVAAVRRDPAGVDTEARSLVESLVRFPGKVFLVDNASLPQLRALQEPLRRWLMERASRHQILLRTGPNPQALPVYEVSVFTFGSGSG